MEPKSMRDLIAGVYARYVTVRPDGLELCPGETVDSLAARMLGFHPARTLYERRQPICRSLDAVRPLQGEQTCAGCVFRSKCTQQMCVELVAEGVPARLLLAFTSLRNFLVFVEERRRHAKPIEGANILVAVRNRGHWGEVCFLEDRTPGA